MRRRQHPLHWFGTVLMILGGCSLVAADVARNPGPAASEVRELIQQLGSTQYAIRKSAEDQLRQIGRTALDHLLIAQFDTDPEIRFNVRQLLAKLPIRWWSDDSPQIVQELTGKFGSLSRPEKVIHAYWLVRLEDGIGLPALARIVRFETSEMIAKQAALAVIDELDQFDTVQVTTFLRVFDEVLAASPRPPAQWLARFAADLRGDQLNAMPSPSWKSLTDAELSLQDTDRFDPFVAAMLCEQWAEASMAVGDENSTREAVTKLVELRKESSRLIVETSLWLIENQQYELFQELIWNEFKEARETVPMLAYCDFMSKRRQGKAKAAQQAADAAFAMTENDTLFPDVFERAYTRLQLARKLELEDHVDLAIREYRRLIDMKSQYQITGVQYDAVSYLSELLHDRQREAEAADVLAKIAVPGKDSLVGKSEEDPSNVSRMHYFRSEHHRQRGERAKQIEFLNKAVEANPTDADVLIAMYRLPRADAAWKKRTSNLIAQAVQKFENQLKPLRAAGEFENSREAATYLNQVAWLVSNTEGDFEKAIQQSRRSLELRPASGGSLDTLGRAYFAAGDMTNAIRYQRRAVRLLPASYQIVRQLEEFELKQKLGK